MDKTELEVFAHNIVWLRKHFRLSKKRMAELLGIGLWSLNQIERGVVPPRLTVAVLFMVQRQFGISPNMLFNRLFEENGLMEKESS